MPRYKFLPNNSPAGYIPPGLARRKAGDLYKSELETNFPKVVQAIVALWGYQELNDYFLKLMINERGDRVEFPPQAWAEIDLLQLIHHEVFALKHQ